MKRLKFYLLSMDNNTTTYREMYAADTMIPAGTPGNPYGIPQFVSEPTFWYEDISFTIEMTNKNALDRPTILMQIPAKKLGIDEYPVAAADECYRQWIRQLESMNTELYNRNKPFEMTGYYFYVQPGGEILTRNSAYFTMRPRKDYYNAGQNKIIHFRPEEVGEPQMCVSMRFQVQLPHKRIKKVLSMLVEDIPQAALMFVRGFDCERAKEVILLARKQKELREWLKTSDYCAFLANGSILPRDSKTNGPLAGAVPFEAPKEDTVMACGIEGLGIRKGVTVITGGGYSGKSTVIDTVSAGIYDHALGDGRELCITDETAMTIAAEDGRCVKSLDISPFIAWLPCGSTKNFTTEHASGSTSQAANILESVDCGAKLLLIDEDKSATNFMIRDSLMKDLIRREPITPFTERVNELFRTCGVSTILVIGGSGEYLGIADNVLLMDEYRMYNVTAQARALGQMHVQSRVHPEGETFQASANNADDATKMPVPAVKPVPAQAWHQNRVLLADGFTPYPKQFGPQKLEVPDVGFILIGDEKIDTNLLHDIACQEQRTAIGFMLRLLEARQKEAAVDLTASVRQLYEEIAANGLDIVYSGTFPGCERFLACPRESDLYAVINRMRRVRYQSPQ